MFYEWLPGGWGGRNGKDGANVTTACFGTGLMSQPNEGNERVNPTRPRDSRSNRIQPVPANGAAVSACRRRPCCWRPKTPVMSYICDRERAVVWGIEGGLPSMPHGLTIRRAGEATGQWLGSVFSDYPSSQATNSRGRRPAAAASAIRWSAIRAW